MNEWGNKITRIRGGAYGKEAGGIRSDKESLVTEVACCRARLAVRTCSEALVFFLPLKGNSFQRLACRQTTLRITVRLLKRYFVCE